MADQSGVKNEDQTPDNLRVRGITAYIESIFLNMLTNAIKFRSPEKKAYLKISADVTLSEVIIRFEDNGLGIDLEKHGSKLFGMYKTFHNVKGSKGLGLFISRYQAEAMSGRIEVTSKPGLGTTFHIHLPHE